MGSTPVFPRFAHAALRAVLSREAYERATGDLIDLTERVADLRGARAARRACIREAAFIVLWSVADGVRRTVDRLAHRAVPPLADSPAIGGGGTPSMRPTRRRAMGDLGLDLRYGARALRRSPGFAAMALLTLALGIGATTALFSVVDRVLLDPAPWPEAGRVAIIGWDWGPGGLAWGLSPGKADYWRRHSQSFEAFAIADDTRFVLTGEGEPERLSAERVSNEYFRVIGMAPAIGRAFSPEEDVPGGPPVAILSDGLWRRSFGAEPGIVGRAITLDGESHTVIGVMPPAFERGTSSAHPVGSIDLLAPLRLEVDPRSQAHNYVSLGRLAAGVTADRLEAEAAELTRQFERAYPGMIEEDNAFRSATYADYVVDYVVGPTLSATVWLSFGAVGLLLVIACANVASLLLARADTRRRELAVRAALGAGRGRLVSHLMAESVLLGLLGGALGVTLARWGLDAILALAPERAPGLDHVGLSIPVLGFAFLVSLLTGIGVGLAGAVHALRPELAATLKEAGRIPALRRRGGRNARSMLIMIEVAVSVVLLVGAGLLLASLLRLRAVDLGLEAEGVYTVEMLRLFPERYTTTDATWRFERQVLERLRALPGVTAAGSASNLPLARGLNIRVNILTSGEREDSPRPSTIDYRAVSPDFLDIVGVRTIEGRGFTDADHAGSPAVALVNETFVRRFLTNDDPVGAVISVDEPEDGTVPALSEVERTVVGVVHDVKDFGPRQDVRPTIYTPRSQAGDGATQMMNEWFAPAFVLRANNPTALAAGINRAVQEVDPSQPILRMQPLIDVVAASMANDRFFLRLLGAFAGLALLLTAVGVYGVVSYAVGQRTHEIGLRMALGAGRRGVVGLVVRQGMISVAIGLAAGVVAAGMLSRLLADLLFEVSTTDPATFAGVALLLAAVALFACYIPARRASRVDPMIVLRAE